MSTDDHELSISAANTSMNIVRVLHARCGRALRSKLARNFLSLSVVQAANAVLPLALLPYLARVLGLEKFGVISYSLALITLFTVFVEYGYGLAGVREVSVNRREPAVLQRVVSRKLQCQLVLGGASAIVLTLLLAGVPHLGQWALVHVATSGLVVAAILSPGWFLQGVEEPALFARFTLANRLAYVALVFLLVSSEEDYWLVPVLNSSAAIVGAAAALFITLRRWGLRLRVVPWTEVFESLRADRSAFVAVFSSSGYQPTIVLILGAFVSEAAVGVFAMADRIIWSLRMVQAALFSVMYPRVCLLAQSSISAARALLRSLLAMLAPGALVVSALLFVFAEPILTAALGQHPPGAAEVLQWLSPIPLLLALNTASYQLLLARGRQKECTAVILTASAIGVGLTLALAPHSGAQGTALSLTAAELITAGGLIAATEVRLRSLSIWRARAAESDA